MTLTPRACRSSGRSTNPASSVTSFGRAVADSLDPEESIMRRRPSAGPCASVHYLPTAHLPPFPRAPRGRKPKGVACLRTYANRRKLDALARSDADDFDAHVTAIVERVRRCIPSAPASVFRDDRDRLDALLTAAATTLDRATAILADLERQSKEDRP